MALSVGTNCGFCSSAPSSDPSGDRYGIINQAMASKFTSPSGNNKVTEIGWWQDDTARAATAYQAAVYTHDAGNDRPNAVVGSIQTGNSTTDNTAAWYKYTGLNISISASTTYWLAVSIENVVNGIDNGSIAGNRRGIVNSNPTLDDPFGAFSSVSDNLCWAIYAVYEADGGTYTASGTAVPAGAFSRLLASLRTYSSAITPSGIFSRILEIIRNYLGELSPSGAFTRLIEIIRVLAGILEPSGSINRLVEKLRVYSSDITFEGSAQRLSQNLFTRLKDGVLSINGGLIPYLEILRSYVSELSPSGILSKTIETIRTYTSGISFEGIVLYSRSALYSESRDGILDIVGDFFRLFEITKLYSSSISFAGTVLRSSEIARTISGVLNLDGVGTRLSAFLTGKIYRQIQLALTYTSELSFSSTLAIYSWGKSIYGVLSSTGDLTRNIITRKTVSGLLALEGIGQRLSVFLVGAITKQIQRAKTYSSELSFSGIVDGVKLHISEATLSLEGAIYYLYGKLNIYDGVLLLNGSVTYAYDFLKTTLGGVVDLYGEIARKFSIGRLTTGVLDLAGAIYYAIAEMFTENKSGSITPSGEVRKGRGKNTSGGLFGGGGDTGFVFDKGSDFTFEDSSDYIWGSSIGIVTWVLTQLRLYPGIITPTGRAMRWLQGSGRKSGAITPSSVVTRRLNLLRQYAGTLDLSGAVERPNQGTDSDRIGYMTVEGIPSRLVSKLRTYASEITLDGTLAFSKIGINWRLTSGSVNISASVSRQLQIYRRWIITVIPASQALWFFTKVYRLIALARSKAGELTLAGVVSWALSDRFGSVRGVLDLVGLASRSSILARAKDGILSFAGEARAYIGYMTFPKPIGDLVIAGAVSRVIDVNNLRVGDLSLSGVSNRQSELNRSDAGSLTFSGAWDEWREALYYGPEI